MLTEHDIAHARAIATTPGHDSIQSLQDSLRRVVEDWERQQSQVVWLQSHSGEIAKELFKVKNLLGETTEQLRAARQTLGELKSNLQEMNQARLDMDNYYVKFCALQTNALARVIVGNTLMKDERWVRCD